MAYYYDQFDSSTNAGAVLWVGDAGYSGNGVTVSWEGGWHSFAGSWYVSYIYNSIGRDAGAGEVRRDYVDDGSVSGSGDKLFTSYTETFPRYSYNYNVTLYSYVRASVNGATREAQAEYTFTVPAIPPAFNTLNVTRVSDNQVNLSWTAASGNISAVSIERSVDGGSFSEVAVIWSASATSWQDTATTADHSYTYRARYHHGGAYGPYSNTVTVTMTPSAPQTITTAAIQGSTNVAVELGNASPVATSLEWQASTDGGQTWSASTTVSGSPVTSFTATGISGTAYIRVRNVNAAGASDWLVSEQVTTICPPAAPTLTSPSGNVLNIADGSVTFSWLHNSLDGSSQTAAQLDYSVNGGSTWTTVTKSTEQSHTVSPIPWAAGTTVTWRVRTKGADASYGEWSQSRTFSVYTAPTLSITSPGATITGMPISLTATYSDMAGFTCQAATVSLTKDGRTLYSEPATINGTSITSSLDVSEFLPTNGETYKVVLTARSSSSLQTTATATFLVDFTEPQAGELQITNDPDTGYVSLLATFDNSASEITYTGSTNAQYESTEGYVRSLTVEGKSEVRNGSLVSIEGATIKPSVNIEPFFSHDWTDVYDASTNPNGYWRYAPWSDGGVGGNTINASGTQLDDGWSHLDWTGHMTFRCLAATTPMLRGQIKAGMQYTLMVEVRNFTGDSFQLIFPAVSGNASCWSSTVYQTAITSDGVYRYVTSAKDPLGTANQNRVFFVVNPNSQTIDWTLSCDIRLSMYEGNYTGAYVPYIEPTTIPAPLRSAGSVHDELQADADSWTVKRNVGVRSYQSGDESDPETSMSRIEIGSAFTVATDLDSTFEMTTWDGSADAESISVARVNPDETLTPLLTDGSSGSGIVDKYAPLNTPYKYAVTTKASSQAVKTVYVDNELSMRKWFAYSGNIIAAADYTTGGTTHSYSRPNRVRVHYVGRKNPVSYDDGSVDFSVDTTFFTIDKAQADAFERIMENDARGIVKTGDGLVYHADFELSTSNTLERHYSGKVVFKAHRIEGERL